MSSLQKALDDAANRLKLKKLGDNKSGPNNNDKATNGGAFESSFAQGLDISELLSTDTAAKGTTAKTATSAAEELLKIREEERKQRQIQEHEEAKMQEALQKRLSALAERKKAKAREQQQQRQKQRSSFEIGDALVRMHGTDAMAADILSQKATTTGNGNRRGRKSASRRIGKSNNKPSFSKKSRKTKF